MGAADSAFDPQLPLLVVNRRVESIEIVEQLPVLERAIVALGRLKVELTSETEVLI
jgi:hypothetical protein